MRKNVYGMLLLVAILAVTGSAYVLSSKNLYEKSGRDQVAAVIGSTYITTPAPNATLILGTTNQIISWPTVAVLGASKWIVKIANSNGTYTINTSLASFATSVPWPTVGIVTTATGQMAMLSPGAYTLSVCYINPSGSTVCNPGQVLNLASGTVPAPTSPAPVISLTVNGQSGTVSTGYNTSLVVVWNATNASSCSLTSLPILSSWTNAVGASGSTSVGPLTTNATLTATCTGSGGTASNSLNVQVAAPASGTATNGLLAITSPTAGSSLNIGSLNQAISWKINAIAPAGSPSTRNWDLKITGNGNTQTLVSGMSGPYMNASYIWPKVGTLPNGSTLSPGAYQFLVCYTDQNSVYTCSLPSSINLVNQPTNTDSATFVKQDTTISTNWATLYGNDGRAVAGGTPSFPTYASVIRGGSDVDQLATFPTWYGTTPYFDITIKDGSTRQVAIYAKDLNGGRSERFDVISVATGQILSSQTISSFTTGVYLIWNISGHVNIKISSLNSQKAVASGIFFGSSAASVAQPTINLVAAGKTGSVTIPYNTSDFVSWSSTDATACTLSSSPSVSGWSGTVGTSGSKSTGVLTSSVTFIVSCSNTFGLSTSAAVVVNVQSSTPTGGSYPTPTVGNPTPVPVQDVYDSDPYGETISWPTVTGADGYAVYLNGTLFDVAHTNVYDTNDVLMPDTNYTFYVEAIADDADPPLIPLATLQRKSFLANLWQSLLAQVTGATTLPAPLKIKTPPAQPIVPKNTVKVLAVVASFLDSGGMPQDSPNGVKGKFDAADGVVKFWEENSFNLLKLNATVFPTVVRLPGNMPSFSTVYNGVMSAPTMDVSVTPTKENNNATSKKQLVYESVNKELITQIDPSTNKPFDLNDPNLIIVYVWPNADILATWAGLADTTGNLFSGSVKGRIWIKGLQAARVFAHEIGHKLGLEHADRLYCGAATPFSENCNYAKSDLKLYGDSVNVMSLSAYFHINPSNKYTLGWIPTSDVVEIKKTGTYTVLPTEKPGTKFMYIAKKDSGDVYFLDYRQKIGTFDSKLNDLQVGVGLGIRKMTSASSGTFATVTGPNGHNEEGFAESLLNHSLQVLYDYSDDPIWSPFLIDVPNPHYFDDNINHIRVIQRKHDMNGAEVFVRVETDKAVPVPVAKWNTPGKSAALTISWSGIDSATGYEIYRDTMIGAPLATIVPKSTGGYDVIDDPTLPPIFNLDANNTYAYTDWGYKVPSTDPYFWNRPHTYYVRAYDSFPESPNKKYYLPFSTAVTSQAVVASVTATAIANQTNAEGQSCYWQKYVLSTTGTAQNLYGPSCAISSLTNMSGATHYFLISPAGNVGGQVPAGKVYPVAYKNTYPSMYTGVIVSW